jgi:hypothetical protein
VETFSIPEDAQKLVSQVEHDLMVTQSFTIASKDNYVQAGEILKMVKGHYQQIEAKRKEMTVPLDETKKRIMDFFRQPLERLSNAERVIKAEIVRFTQEQERLRRIEEERLQALAREEQRRRDEILEKQIAQAQEQGDNKTAEALLESATQAAVPVVQAERPKVEGIKIGAHWKYRIIDEGLIPREYLIPNEKLLASIAVSSKGTVKVAGVEFYPETIVAARAV